MAKTQKDESQVIANMVGTAEREVCGIIMPIAAMGDYLETHWTDVLEILKSSLADVTLDAGLVSYAEETSLIHTTIVQNLYDNPVVVCDVSGKNPNVMFELGMRLAFDKPTIIIKDDSTGYSFDTGSIEHLTYPRDLRFGKIVESKLRLGEKVRATLERSKADPNYSTFLKHFKRVTVAKLEDKEVSGQEFVLEELRSIRRDLVRMDRPRIESRPRASFKSSEVSSMTVPLFGMDNGTSETLADRVSSFAGVKLAKLLGDQALQRIEIVFEENTPRQIVDHIANIISRATSTSVVL